MPTYELNGVPVEFPHDAYPCQLTFMQHVLSALEASEHALLESPTGTGKTLSLLCAALAWRTAVLARKQFALQTTAPLPDILSTASQASDADSSFMAYKNSAGAKEVNLRRLEAALSSAAGTSAGASAGASTSTNAAASTTASSYEHIASPREQSARGPLIVYASRTHSQLAQVVRELRRTSYRPRVSVIGSREQLCIHPEVRKLPTSSVQSTVCQRLVRKKACEFYSHVSEGVEHLVRHGEQHPEEVMDLEDILRFATQHRACPYYAARQRVEDADLVLLPYNYLLDRKTMGATMLDLRGACVIFDEAHNVESSCGDAVSCELSTDDLALAHGELRQCLELVDSDFFAVSLSGASVSKDSVASAMRFIEALRRALLDPVRFPIPATEPFVASPGDCIFDLFRDAGLDELVIEDCLESFEEISKLWLEHQYNMRSSRRSAFQVVVNAVRTVYGLSGRRDESKGVLALGDDIEGDAARSSDGSASPASAAHLQHLRTVKQSARDFYRVSSPIQPVQSTYPL
jgi:hypothetical protein